MTEGARQDEAPGPEPDTAAGKWLRRYFDWLLPDIEDETDRLRAELLALSLLLFFTLVPLTLPLLLFVYPGWVLSTVLLFSALHVFTLMNLRAGRIELAATLLMLSVSGLAFTLMIRSNGVYDVAMFLLPILLFASAMTMRRGAYVLLSACIILGTWGVAALHFTDWYELDWVRAARSQVALDLFFYTLFLLLMAVVAQTFTGALYRLLRRARRSERALQTVNRELDRRVARRTAELETATRELETFAYSISHDLRTPLRAISGYASIMREESGDTLAESDRELLQRIDDAAKRLSALIDGLLRFSRLNTRTLDPQPVHLDDLVRSVVRQEVRAAPDRAIEWHIGPLPAVEADLQLLRHVVQNLVNNAIKFTAGVDPAVIRIDARQDGEWTCLQVSDNGAGFDPAYADKLYRVFQRLHSPREFPGDGVGLATVKRIVERHGGRVAAESGVGPGARFAIALPTRAVAHHEPESPPPLPLFDSPAAGQKR